MIEEWENSLNLRLSLPSLTIKMQKKKMLADLKL